MLAQSVERLLRRPLGLLLVVADVVEGTRIGFDLDRERVERSLRLIALGRQLEPGGVLAGTAPDDVLGHHVAGSRHDGDRAAQLERCKLGARRGRLLQVIGDERECQDAAHALWCVEHVIRVLQGGLRCALDHGRRAGHDELGPAQVSARSGLGGCDSVIATLDEHCLGERAERRRDRRLIALLHGDPLGDGAEHPVEARFENGGCGALGLQGHRQRLCLGSQRIALALLRVQLLTARVEPLLQRRCALVCGPVRGCERIRVSCVALVVACLGRMGFCMLESLARLLDRRGSALAVVLPCALRRRGDLNGRALACQLEVVLRHERRLLGDLVIECVEAGLGARNRRRLGRRQRLQLGNAVFVLSRLAHCGVDSLSRDSAVIGLCVVVGCRKERSLLVRQRLERLQPRAHALEPVHDRARLVDFVADHLLFDPACSKLRAVELLLQHESLVLSLLLRRRRLLEGLLEQTDLVCVELRPGVAHVCLHRLRLAGDLGLRPERLQLPADLADQVAQPRQVLLHGLELAQRLLLAATVLENAGGLFDVAPAVLRGRLQHVVELALPDDHVHLSAEPRVAQQLLHVEQAHRLAVDRVLAASVSKQRARDLHLGVLDRQRAVGVVDRELDMRTRQRPLCRGAGEDDVFHLSAAQRLRALLAHDPCECIDDVRLARPIGADDRGHTGFELKRRGARERLEALHGQGSQIHGTPCHDTRIAQIYREDALSMYSARLPGAKHVSCERPRTP